MSNKLSVKNNTETVISLGTMHPGQIKAYWALQPHRYKILRCGRRFGKTEFAKIWIGQGLLQGWECAWLSPQHKIWSEAYMEIKGIRAISVAYRSAAHSGSGEISTSLECPSRQH